MNQTSQFSTIIFDYDGVLADNHQFNFLACQVAAKACGVELTESEYLEYFYPGQYLIGGTQSLLAKYHKQNWVEKFIQIKTQQDPLYTQAVKPISGAIEFVNWAFEAGFQLAIGSGARRPLIEKFLVKYDLTQKFTLLVTAEDVTNSKPNPETYLKLLAQLNISTKNAIIIEDSVAGISAAIAAKCFVIGLVSTSPAEALKKANKIANSYSEIPKIINQVSQNIIR